ncbi:MAG: hypothetical protein M3Y19_06855 [Actinomycetota bacterium]|nr:hypothetical protein [Actinomycetota bacterium]
MTADEVLLYDAAFGEYPGTHPLPSASTTTGRWWRAVTLGGQGRYAAAQTELDLILRESKGGPWVSLAASTRGSHLRQLGRHAAAQPWDARALVAASTPQARVDALLGLAADALGTGQAPVAQRLLSRCAPSLDTAGWRGRLRWHWVSAETALCTGEGGLALQHARQGNVLAQHCPSRRHQVKSRLILAAAQGRDGGQLARELVEQSAALGLLPLQWAAAMLLNALEPGQEADDHLEATSELLHRRGGVLG